MTPADFGLKEINTHVNSLRAAIIIEVAVAFERDYKTYVSLPTAFRENYLTDIRFFQKHQKYQDLYSRITDEKDFDECPTIFENVDFLPNGEITVFCSKWAEPDEYTARKVANVVKRLLDAFTGKKTIYSQVKDYYRKMCNVYTKFFDMPNIEDWEVELLSKIIANPAKFRNNENAKKIIGCTLNPFISESLTIYNNDIFNKLDKFKSLIANKNTFAFSNLPNATKEYYLNEIQDLFNEICKKIEEKMNIIKSEKTSLSA